MGRAGALRQCWWACRCRRWQRAADRFIASRLSAVKMTLSFLDEPTMAHLLR